MFDTYDSNLCLTLFVVLKGEVYLIIIIFIIQVYWWYGTWWCCAHGYFDSEGGVYIHNLFYKCIICRSQKGEETWKRKLFLCFIIKYLLLLGQMLCGVHLQSIRLTKWEQASDAKWLFQWCKFHLASWPASQQSVQLLLSSSVFL